MEHVTNALSRLSSVLTKYIGMIIICFSVIAFFWRDGFAWTTNYTSIFLGVAMFGMGLTIHIGDFKVVFTRPKEIIIGFIAQYTIMPLIAWGLSVLLHLPTDIALGVILVGCCPGGTASNVITYIAGGDVALSVGMTSTGYDAASGISTCRCMGSGIFSRDGDLGCKGRTDPGSSGYPSPQTDRQTY